MRVALFIPSLAGGGAERVFSLLSRDLPQAGCRVDLVLTQRTGPYLDDLPSTVRVVSFDTTHTALALPSLLRYVWRERPDVLCSALPTANIAAAIVATLCRAAGRDLCYVPTIHYLLSQRERRAETWKARIVSKVLPWALCQANGVVAVSAAVASDAVQWGRLTPEKVCTIYNPVDVERIMAWEGPPPHAWMQNPSGPVLVAAGRMVGEKDFPTLLHAIRRLDQGIRLILLGDGPERSHLRHCIRALGIEDRVAIPGFVDNIYGFLHYADVFVLSSHIEAFGNVVVEALASGTPVVCTRAQGGVEEIFTAAPDIAAPDIKDGTGPKISPLLRGDGTVHQDSTHAERSRNPAAEKRSEYGRLVPSGDPDRLAHAIREVLMNPPRPEVSRDRARRFSSSNAAEAYAQLFQDLTSRSTPHPSLPAEDHVG